ncbi:pentapeptide repeat-containing protein [Streptomyces sp. CA2R101]|uniref:pentapeptide repeat-containing protein n=1 Tax=Streptomyces sp. CA2R101 TaxID=3120152 RepID=UPI003008CE2E
MTDDERAEHAARLRGLLYLACPDAPAWAIASTAEAITQHEEPLREASPPVAAHLVRPRQSGTDRLDLNGAYLTGADLSRANLRWAKLCRADLSSANLSDADLSRANLGWAELCRADLNGADLSGADLRRADLRWAELRRADLRRADLRWADLRRADLRWAELRRADLSDAVLRRADLSGANLSGVNLTRANLSGAMLTGATNMRLPTGAIWNWETLWPANLASNVAEHSDQVSPGVYQVRHGGSSRDRDAVQV